MDPLTHGLTGSAVARLVSDKQESRLPYWVGFLSAQLPDLDVLFQVTSDPLTGIELHRHFTHSLLFAPVGSALVGGLFWLFLRKKSTYGALYIMILAAWVSAVLLDACTSYGTHLLLPLSNRVISWNLISVVDPVVTVGMLIFAAYSLRKPNYTGSVLMVSWLGLFLIYGGVQNYRVTTFAIHHIEGLNRAVMKGGTVEDDRYRAGIDRYVVKPTIGNQLLWRVTYESGETVRTAGVRAGIFRGMQLYQGESAQLLSPDDERFEGFPPGKREDIARFWSMSDGYMIFHPEKPAVLGDARYSMLPTSLNPLWGIDISVRGDDSHTPYLYFRDSSPEVRRAFIRMLLGRDVE